MRLIRSDLKGADRDLGEARRLREELRDREGEGPGDGGSGTKSLTVSLAGDGSGAVRSDPAGIDCPEQCSGSFRAGRTVILTATSEPESVFAGFTDACATESETCTVEMTKTGTVTASFEPETFELSIRLGGEGQGTVTSSPGEINCDIGPEGEGPSGTCTGTFQAGDVVVLTATTPSEFSTFEGFSGELSEGCNNPCTVTMDRNRAVGAGFSGI